MLRGVGGESCGIRPHIPGFMRKDKTDRRAGRQLVVDYPQSLYVGRLQWLIFPSHWVTIALSNGGSFSFEIDPQSMAWQDIQDLIKSKPILIYCIEPERCFFIGHCVGLSNIYTVLPSKNGYGTPRARDYGRTRRIECYLVELLLAR